MSRVLHSPARSLATHLILIAYAAISVFPLLVVLINSPKSRKAIFSSPLRLPFGDAFSLVGYETVMKRGHFPLYFLNSLIVTASSLFFVLLFGAMAAFALSEYRFRGNPLVGVFFAMMIPIRLGTVAILQMMVATGLVDTLVALIIVYVAQGLPLAIFILTEFMLAVSDDLKDAGRIDGFSNIRSSSCWCFRWCARPWRRSPCSS